ncbi:MAG TPA: nuclear transport factor 2 family protein [Gemmatimonadaceae bacterium]|nr:nuclear transport factor 2 family protein [Gemmatimonadaceae bacterium]
MIRTIALAALLGFTVSSPGWSQCSTADKAALEAFDKAWGDASVRGDRAFLESAYADNFVAITSTGTVDRATTLANTMRDAELNRTNPQPVATPDHYVITCTPLTATITHRNVIASVYGSTGAPTYSRSVHVLEKRGNRWLVVSNAGHGLTDQMELAYLEQEWNDASKRRDAGWVERNYAPFATDIASRTGALENKSQAIASMKNETMVLESLELSDLSTRVEGDVAVVTGVNHVKGRDAQGKLMDRKVRFTDTFIRRDGRWQVWATQGTTIQ